MADKEDFESSWNDATRRYTKARRPSIMVETSDSKLQVLPTSGTPSSRVSKNDMVRFRQFCTCEHPNM